MLLKIPRLYDSHAHFIATGEFTHGLMLGEVKTIHDLKRIDQQNPSYFRQNFMVGFGIDLDKWSETESFNKTLLDTIFPDIPVCFAKKDGHGCFLNTLGIQELGLTSSDGVLTEKEHLAAWDKLPSYSHLQWDRNVQLACRVFNQSGFTHVRDLSCTEDLWSSLMRVYDGGNLTLALEENFTVHYLHQFDAILSFADYTRKNSVSLVRSKGIKIFYDGSLGSETAYLSKEYLTTPGNRGRVLWPLSEVEEMLIRTWEKGLEFSVHTIGDQAAHDIIELARRVSASGKVGRLNIEHGQLLRPETIQMMKPLHVRVHMQPCHWLSDREWLYRKIGDLGEYVFPWRALEAAQIPISFGCDSPVEPTSFLKNIEALNESAKAGIKPIKQGIEAHHSHPDINFGSGHSIFDGTNLVEVVFNGQKLNI